MGLDQRYRRIYFMLKRHGHDAAKAIEIILDCTRRDPWAMRWVRALRVIR